MTTAARDKSNTHWHSQRRSDGDGGVLLPPFLRRAFDRTRFGFLGLALATLVGCSERVSPPELESNEAEVKELRETLGIPDPANAADESQDADDANANQSN